MGGLVRAIAGPKEVPVEPFRTVVADSGEQNDEAEKEKARKRRSRQGTIATSARGILRRGSLAPARKSLLGE